MSIPAPVQALIARVCRVAVVGCCCAVWLSSCSGSEPSQAAATSPGATPVMATSEAGSAAVGSDIRQADAGPGQGSTAAAAGSSGAPPTSGMATLPAPTTAGAAGAGALVDAGAASDTAAAGPTEWVTGKPEDFGLDPAVLESTAEALQRSSNGTRYGMVVIRRGVLVYEKYWNGTSAEDAHIIYSCTKSWGSTLIGIAVTRKLLAVEDPVTKWVPDPVPAVSSAAQIKHLLTQSAHTTPPGTSFRYNSGSIINTLPEALESASGMPGRDFYERYLRAPLGLSLTWPACPPGGCPNTRYKEGFIQFGDQPPEAPNQDILTSTVREQAKLGWLWANNGNWNGEQLIDPEYVAQATQSQIQAQSDYGYLWWLENEEQFMGIGGTGECWIDVMPSRQLVIAVLGQSAGLGAGGNWQSFRPIVDSLRD